MSSLVSAGMLRILRASSFASHRLLQATVAALPSFFPPAASYGGCRFFSSERGSARSAGAVALNNLSPAPGSRRVAKRLGRGIGSGNALPSSCFDTKFAISKMHLTDKQARARPRGKVTRDKLRATDLLDQALRAAKRLCIAAFQSADLRIQMPYF